MKVAIIGAGVSGLTAAQHLTTRGFKVEVFEKSRGLGGRLATKRLDWAHMDTGAQYFTARDPRFVQAVKNWQQAGVVEPWPFTPYSISADGALLPSPDQTLRYVGVPGMNNLAHALADNLTVHRNQCISQLVRNKGRWKLVSDSGDQFTDYDWVIVSAPAEQSRVLLNGHTPIAEQISSELLEPCLALVIATTGPVPKAVQGIFGDSTVGWVSRLSAKPQRTKDVAYDDLWLLHFSSQWSADYDPIAAEDIVPTGLEWLQHAIDTLPNQNQQKPLKLVNHCQHYWRFARMAKNAQQPPTLIDRTNHLAAIGDWSHGGRIEGAYLSALHLVDTAF